MGQTVNLLSLTSVVRIHPPPPRKPLHRQVWRFFFLYGWTRRGAGVNDAPAARRSRGTARPQTGESTLLHHHPVERLDDFLCLVDGNHLLHWKCSQKGVFLFCAVRHCKPSSLRGPVNCIGADQLAVTKVRKILVTNRSGGGKITRNLSVLIDYHKNIVKSRIKLQDSCDNRLT